MNQGLLMALTATFVVACVPVKDEDFGDSPEALRNGLDPFDPSPIPRHIGNEWVKQGAATRVYR